MAHASSSTDLAGSLLAFVRQNPEQHAHRGMLLDYAVDIEGATEAQASEAVAQLERDGHMNGKIVALRPTFQTGKRGRRTMEVKLIERLLDLGASNAHFKVLTTMSQFLTWETGATYVSVKGLAKRTGCDKDTVKAAFDWAEKVGIIIDKRKAPIYTEADKRTEYVFDPTLLSDYGRAK